MKIYHLALVFIIAVGILFASATVIIVERQRVTSQRERYKEALDQATKSCAEIVRTSGVSGVYGIRDEAAEAFFGTLSMCLGGTESGPLTEALKQRVPMLLICDEEGFFIRYEDVVTTEDGEARFVYQWTECLPYDDNWPDTVLAEYCNKYNRAAQRFGLQTEFSITREDGLFLRKNTQYGVYSFFQGEVYPELFGGSIGCSSFAQTGIVQTPKYFINIHGEGYASERYYHKENCDLRTERSMCFTSCEECAAHGAYACPCCFNCPDYSDAYVRGNSNRN